jgi:phage major head subunit gpT-like protein
MNRSQFNKSVVPGLFSFMSSSFQSRPAFWSQITNVKSSRRAYEESAYYTGLGLVPEKPEGEPIGYDDFIQGPTKRWSHKTYGLGVRITEEMIEDALYPDIPTEMSDMTKELGHSAKETIEVLVHDIYNGTTKTAGDGVAVFSTAHTKLGGGTWSNLLSPAADLAVASLRQAIVEMENTTDDRSKQQVVKPKILMVAPQEEWTAREILNSAYDPESAENAINPLQSRNLQLIVNPYLTDADAWFLIADQNPFITYMRRKVKFAKDGDFETGDAKFKTSFRLSTEVNYPLGVYKSAGA